jgi:hypothetical protein
MRGHSLANASPTFRILQRIGFAYQISLVLSHQSRSCAACSGTKAVFATQLSASISDVVSRLIASLKNSDIDLSSHRDEQILSQRLSLTALFSSLRRTSYRITCAVKNSRMVMLVKVAILQ